MAPLVDAGILEVVPDPQDGRAKILRYTARGRRTHAASLRIYDEIESAFVARVGERSVADLRQALAELRTVAESDR